MTSIFNGDETAPFFGFLGAAAALVFSCMGAAYGTAKSGVGVASMGVMRPELVMKSIVPVVMAGVLGIYGLIIAVIISTGINPKAKGYYLFDGYAHLSSGLACGLAGLSAGMAIGIVGDAGVRNLTMTSLKRISSQCPNFRRRAKEQYLRREVLSGDSSHGGEETYDRLSLADFISIFPKPNPVYTGSL
ncbi:hypothetical protein V2J09_011668 [Rumex salicifolius]